MPLIKYPELKSKNGAKRNPLYVVWQNMRLRCRSSDDKAQRYHDRGITICAEWLNSWPAFSQWATANGWEPGLEIDRRENNKGYCPDNCRFVPHLVNARNQERVRPVRCVDTGRVYPSQGDAFKQTGIWNINAALNGKRRVAGGMAWEFADNLVAVAANAKPKPGEKLIGVAPCTVVMAADSKKDAPLPDSVVWMPKGDHDISASTMAGSYWSGLVRCDELGASVVAASYNKIIAAGLRVWFDKNHDDGEATAWIRGFSWDPSRGIIAAVEWTPLGEQLLREKRFYSFSPTFWVDWESGRVSGLVEGHAAGGLVNAPAFGAAMPALIAARLGGAESTTNSVPGGSPGNHQSNTSMNREKMLKVLAALAVTVPADSTDAQVAALYAQHVPTTAPANAAAEIAALREQLTALQSAAAKPEEHAAIKAMKANLDALVAAAKVATKKRAEAAVQAAVERGALKAEDTALQAKWVGFIESDESHLELLAALPGKPTAQSVIISPDVTQRNAVQSAEVLRVGIVDALKAYKAERDHKKASVIYASSIGPVMRDPNFRMGPILAANALGSLAGNLVVQRALTLLKITFPALDAFSTDFSEEGAKFNQQVVSRTKAVPASANFVAGTGYAQADVTATDVPVTISNHKGIQINLTANDLASTDRDMFAENVEGVHQRVGLDLTSALYALILNANFANNTVQAAGGFGRPTLKDIAAALDLLGVPQIGRVALLNATYFSNLGNDASIVSFAAFQRPELITENALPRVAGFQPLNCPNLPANGENLAGFCGTPDALVIATRTPNDYTQALPGANNGSVSIVTNPDTGISVQLVQFVDHTKAQSSYRVAYMYGVAVGQAASGRRILSA
jgi:phage I-like protein